MFVFEANLLSELLILFRLWENVLRFDFWFNLSTSGNPFLEFWLVLGNSLNYSWFLWGDFDGKNGLYNPLDEVDRFKINESVGLSTITKIGGSWEFSCSFRMFCFCFCVTAWADCRVNVLKFRFGLDVLCWIIPEKDWLFEIPKFLYFLVTARYFLKSSHSSGLLLLTDGSRDNDEPANWVCVVLNFGLGNRLIQSN